MAKPRLGLPWFLSYEQKTFRRFVFQPSEMTNPKCNSLWLRSKSKLVYISKVTALKNK